MRCGQEFFQGETISLLLHGDEKVRLDEWDFTLSFVRGSYVLQFGREDCEVREDGNVLCVIDAERSENMPVGVYDIELRLEGAITKIARGSNVFLIKESVYGR